MRFYFCHTIFITREHVAYIAILYHFTLDVLISRISTIVSWLVDPILEEVYSI